MAVLLCVCVCLTFLLPVMISVCITPSKGVTWGVLELPELAPKEAQFSERLLQLPVKFGNAASPEGPEPAWGN